MEFLRNLREALVRVEGITEAFRMSVRKQENVCMQATRWEQPLCFCKCFPPESSIPEPAESLFLWEGK